MPILPNTIVRSLEPYHSPGEGRYDFVRLDFNENTRGITEAYPDSLPETWVSAYPEYGELTQRLAEFYKVDPESILLTNGSDEGLSVIASTFIESGQDMAVVSTPCFTMISHYLRLAGAKLIAVPVLADLSFDLKGIEDALKSKVRLAMFDTPVNPTGAILDPEQIRNWCKNYPDTLFVIDEAYGEFAGKSSVSFITEFDNLLVTKTFSKAWAMAGLRLGMVFGQPQLIEYLNRVKSPYSVNSAAVWTASRLLEQADKVTDQVNEIMADKQSLLSELSMRSFEVVPGSANSFLLSMGFNAQQFVNYCKSQGILVRNRSINNSPLWGKVRVSIGTPEENKKFLQTLDSFCAGYGLICDIDGTLVDTSSSFDSTVHEIVLQYS